MSDKNQYKINDKLEQRVKANEDKIVALGNDIEAIIKVLTKMKKELYYTAEESEKIDAEKAAAQKYEDELIEKNNQFQKETKMKNITNKGEIDNDN
jgi:uncharacterized membrane protein|tara:strand:+ start:85 stop:372 length:288 start_codon:yes stop_codon:yes gene_type:complete